MRRLTRQQMLAAEVYGYSYDHYEDHLGIGHVRFEELMPHDVDVLERAEREGWDAARLARALEIPEEKVPFWQRQYRDAKEIVDAPTSVAAFRRGVRISIQNAVEEGLKDEGAIERLVTQIGYRAADFGFRLDIEHKRLSDYSTELREEMQCDTEASDAKTNQSLQESLSTGQ